jgi:hypothetical protein
MLELYPKRRKHAMKNNSTQKKPYMSYPHGREVVTVSIDREVYTQLGQIADLKEIRLTTAINHAIASFVQSSMLEFEEAIGIEREAGPTRQGAPT